MLLQTSHILHRFCQSSYSLVGVLGLNRLMFGAYIGLVCMNILLYWLMYCGIFKTFLLIPRIFPRNSLVWGRALQNVLFICENPNKNFVVSLPSSIKSHSSLPMDSITFWIYCSLAFSYFVHSIIICSVLSSLSRLHWVHFVDTCVHGNLDLLNIESVLACINAIDPGSSVYRGTHLGLYLSL